MPGMIVLAEKGMLMARVSVVDQVENHYHKASSSGDHITGEGMGEVKR